MRPKRQDRGVGAFHGGMELSIAEGGNIMIRSKPTVAATQWSDPLVLVNPNSPDIVCPKYNAKPLIAARKPWPKLVTHIAPKLLKFYSGDSRYQIVHIPPSVRVEGFRVISYGRRPIHQPSIFYWGPREGKVENGGT